MNWQDGLALLIVVGAVFGLMRIGYSTLRGNRRQPVTEAECAETAPPITGDGCQGCALGSCLKTRIGR